MSFSREWSNGLDCRLEMYNGIAAGITAFRATAKTRHERSSAFELARSFNSLMEQFLSKYEDFESKRSR
jgi:hypothetical protein